VPLISHERIRAFINAARACAARMPACARHIHRRVLRRHELRPGRGEVVARLRRFERTLTDAMVTPFRASSDLERRTQFG